MNIHQLNVSHVDREDRLLLRLNTRSAEEFRFWLTRRLALRLLPALDQAVGRLESSTPGVMAPDPASKQILTEIKRDEFMQKADFKTPYAEQAQKLPMGEEPMLVTDVQLHFQGQGIQITLQDKGAPGSPPRSCQLNLPASMVHGLIHLVRQAMDKAQWQGAQETPPTAEPGLSETATGYRH